PPSGPAWPAAASTPTGTGIATGKPRPGWASRPAGRTWPPPPPPPRSASADPSPPKTPPPLPASILPQHHDPPDVEPAAYPERHPGRRHALPQQSLSVELPARCTGQPGQNPDRAITLNYMALRRSCWSATGPPRVFRTAKLELFHAASCRCTRRGLLAESGPRVLNGDVS